MAPRFIPVPDVPVYQPDESLGPKYMNAGGQILSGTPQVRSTSVFDSDPSSAASMGFMEQFANFTEQKADALRQRQRLFESQFALDQAYRDQEAKEADLILSDFLTDLSTFSGTQNWAGMWAKRRQIIDHPLYKNSSQVKNALSELDAGMENFGTDYTSEGREVNFHDVLRMAGSGDSKEQKEAFRILALRSENGIGFIDSIPQSYFASKDPSFRFQLRTFIKENPKINEEDVGRYRVLENEYINSIKQQFSNDPVLVAKMLASDEIRDQLKDMRSSMFYGQKGSFTDWMPKVSKGDMAIRDDDLLALGNAMKEEISNNHQGFLVSIGSAVSEVFGITDPNEAQKALEENPRLAMLVSQKMLPPDTSDEGILAWVKTHPAFSGYAGWLATQKGVIPLWKALRKVAPKVVESTRISADFMGPMPGKDVYTARKATLGIGGMLKWAGAALIVDDVTQQLFKVNAARRGQEQVDRALGRVLSARSNLLDAVSVSSSAERSVNATTRLVDSIDAFNRVSLANRLQYQLDPGMLFGQRQWQAIRSRLMASPGGMQAFGASGLMDRPSFSGRGYGVEGITSQGNIGPGTPYGLSGSAQGSTLPNVNAMTGGVSPAPAAGGGPALPGTLSK